MIARPFLGRTSAAGGETCDSLWSPATGKCTGSRAENAQRIETIAQAFPTTDVECAVCPPHVYLEQVGELLRAAELPIALGAQDVSAEQKGAFTGEVSVSMLEDLGCRFVIVGHSERREAEGEDDHLVARKFEAARSKMIPILCVGRALAERRAGRQLEVIGRQMDAVLERCGARGFGGSVIAYEPRWAIGTGMTASPEQAQEVHAFIRGHLAQQDAKIAGEVRILYGGSVNAGNAAQLFAMPDVDGGVDRGRLVKGTRFFGHPGSGGSALKGIGGISPLAEQVRTCCILFLTVVQFISCICIIALVLIQRGKGADAGAGFGAGAIRHGVRRARRRHCAVARDRRAGRGVHGEQPGAGVLRHQEGRGAKNYFDTAGETAPAASSPLSITVPGAGANSAPVVISAPAAPAAAGSAPN